MSENEFRSILFPGGETVREDVPEPEHFRDLNLDQIVARVVSGRDEYRLEPYFRTPLSSVDAVEYRHEVFRDLEREDVKATVSAFAEDERRVRVSLELVRKQHYAPEKRRWLVDAAALYCETVASLRDALGGIDLASRGLRGLRNYLAAYTGSAAFAELSADADSVLGGLAHVRYTLRINGTRVTVGRYEGESDYSEEVAAAFARFRGHGSPSERVLVADSGSMDHVEARIAELVGRLYPDEFAALEAFWRSHREFVDATVARFERELQFCLAWLDQARLLEESGLRFCYPSVAAEPETIGADDAFDLALALKLRPEGRRVVPNAFALTGQERILVVSGPNQGGKTTFARAVAQLYELARLGLPVPASSARLSLADAVFTHFEREEDIATLRGKLEDELVRVRGILEQATGRSLVVLNEIFSSTTLADAVLLGSAVLDRLSEIGSVAVCVTFVDELASLNEATVSMVATVKPDDPSRRTFEVVRRPADGRAYASAIATKYGLSYDLLRERLA